MKALAGILGLILLSSCPNPSPAPSPAPSPVPSPSPSLAPSPTPSPAPSPLPSPVPSPLPSTPVVTGSYDCDHPPSIAGFIKSAHPTGRYIVKLKQPTQDRVAESKLSASAMGATQVKMLAHGFVGVMSVANALAAAARPDVQYVQEDGRVHVMGHRVSRKVAAAALPWDLDRIDQRTGLDGKFSPPNDGSNVRVAVIDTGIWSHPDIVGGVVPERFSAYGTCVDGHGHGTFVSTEIAGKTLGVAKNAMLVCVKVLDDSGSGAESDVIAGQDWLTQQALSNPGLRYVANESLGGGPCPACDDSVCAGIAAGIQYVVAAGNESADARDGSPADVLQALTVGASDDTDTAADFTNWGPVLDLYAPGVSVVGGALGGGTDVWDGTSMATPLVSGAVALLLHDRPNLTPAQLHAEIVSRATSGAIHGGHSTTPNRLVYVGK